MNRRKSLQTLLACWLLGAGALPGLQAQVVTYTWTGQGPDSNWFTDANWDTAPAPNNDDTASVVFGHTGKTYVKLYDSSRYTGVSAYGLTFSGHSQPYYLDGNYDGYITLYLGAGGLTYNPTQAVRSVIAANVEFTASQTWNIVSGTLVLEGNIYDGDYDYVFTKTGAGTLVFGDYDNDFDASTLNLHDGRLVVNANYYSGYHPLGAADVHIGPATGGKNPILVASNDEGDSVTLSNHFHLDGALNTENHAELHLTGLITLDSDTVIQAKGQTLHLEGTIADSETVPIDGNLVPTSPARKLTIDTVGPVIMSGENTYSGGTHVANGTLIFGGPGSLPATGNLSTSTSGYIGLGDSTVTDLQTGFIDRFDKTATFGTIGFDSPVVNFPGTIDLTGFAASVRLGSATTAYVQATITPQGSVYRFGGGGGWLEVSSALTDQTTPTNAVRSLVVESPAATPLTLHLTNSGNTYSGGTSVTHSGLVFANGSFPAGTRNITINSGGYVGFESWGDQSDTDLVANSLAKITTTSVGMVGFDEIYSLSAPIDLSSFTNALYLGTSTHESEGEPGLVISGLITPAGDASAPYRFAAYKGGALEVASTLTGTRAVHIGDPNSPGTFGDYLEDEFSTVALTGNNSTLTGPVMLYGGQLLVGQSNGTTGTDATNALGSGTLEVAGMTLPTAWQGLDDEGPVPQLGVTTNGLILPNNITLASDLSIAPEAQFTLTGKISGTGELYLESGSYSDRTELTLANDANDFTGGIYLSSDTRLTLDANHAAGTGALSFGTSSSNSEVYFNTSAPVIGGLSSRYNDDDTTLYAMVTDTVLTIDQSFDSSFQGAFRSNAYPGTESLRIVKTGTGTLRLNDGGMYFYEGTTESTLPGTPQVSLQVNQGTLILGNDFYMGETSSTTIWVHGGTLVVDGGVELNNAIVVDNSGRLGGFGSFATSVALGNGAVVSPGMTDTSAIGRLAFDHLELNAGGVYEWQIKDLTNSGHDFIDVQTDETLVINATSSNRFTLKVISLTLAGANGQLSGFDPSQAYSWNIIDYDSLSGTFDPNAFTIDTSQFANSLAFDARGNGTFSLSDVDGQIRLNFTPVPEPSTYALLALGLGFIGLTLWRQSRRQT